MENPSIIKVVAGVILLTPDQKYVLGKRVKPIDAGKFACVGGKVTEYPNDSDVLHEFDANQITQAAQAEVHQELGVKVTPLYYGRHDHYRENADTYYCVYMYYALVSQPSELQPNTLEVSDVLTISPNKLDEVDVGLGHDKVLDEFIQKTQLLPKLVNIPEYPYIEPVMVEQAPEIPPVIELKSAGRQAESSWRYQLNAIFP